MERHDNESLLGKMLVQMTGEELVAIVRMAATVENGGNGTSTEAVKYVYGIQDLAAYIGCCASTKKKKKKRGVLNERIVFNAPLARKLADEYKRCLAGEED